MALFWFGKRNPPAPIEIPEITDPQTMDENEREGLRRAAALEMQYCLQMRETVTAQMITSARWIQTSLLLVNGAGAVALLQSDRVRVQSATVAGVLFVVGIVLALLEALVGIRMSSDAPKVLSRTAGYWLGVTLDLLRVEKVEREFQEYGAELTRRGRWTYAIGFASLLCFLGGCLWAAVGLHGG